MKLVKTRMDVDTLYQLEELDKEVFPEHFWLDDEEADTLLHADTIVVLALSEDNELVGGAYGAPSTQMAEMMEDWDDDFKPNPNKFYIYSVAVSENHRRQGIGRQLRMRLMMEAISAGFVDGCTHTRINGESNIAARKVYSPTAARFIRDLYEAGEHSMYMEFKLKS